jgi:hypothetical protein
MSQGRGVQHNENRISGCAVLVSVTLLVCPGDKGGSFMRTPASVTSLHDRFKCALTHRYFIRLHMTILILLVLLAGLLASRGLTFAGVRNMGVRYAIAVLFSYLVFFVLVRIWIAYVCRASRSRESASSSESSADVGDLFSGGSGGSGGSASGAGKLVEGGGRFGGGGSSASFADAQASTLQAAAVPAPRSGGSSSSSGFSLDLDGDGLLLLILFVLLAAAILGVGVYLIYQGPVILSEAAFQAVLASGLVKTARNAHDPGWMESIFKATVLPFLLVLALAGLFGYEAHKRCPQATTIRQVFRQCIFR